MESPPNTQLKKEQMECNKCAVERFIEDIHSSVFKLKLSACYSIYYKSSFIDPKDGRNFEPHSKPVSSNILFQNFTRMVQEHSTGGDYASIRRTNGGVNTHADFSRKISAVALKFPDVLIKEEKRSRSVFYRLVFDLDCARIAKLAEQEGLV